MYKSRVVGEARLKAGKTQNVETGRRKVQNSTRIGGETRKGREDGVLPRLVDFNAPVSPPPLSSAMAPKSKSNSYKEPAPNQKGLDLFLGTKNPPKRQSTLGFKPPPPPRDSDAPEPQQEPKQEELDQVMPQYDNNNMSVDDASSDEDRVQPGMSLERHETKTRRRVLLLCDFSLTRTLLAVKNKKRPAITIASSDVEDDAGPSKEQNGSATKKQKSGKSRPCSLPSPFVLTNTRSSSLRLYSCSLSFSREKTRQGRCCSFHLRLHQVHHRFRLQLKAQGFVLDFVERQGQGREETRRFQLLPTSF